MVRCQFLTPRGSIFNVGHWRTRGVDYVPFHYASSVFSLCLLSWKIAECIFIMFTSNLWLFPNAVTIPQDQVWNNMPTELRQLDLSFQVSTF